MRVGPASALTTCLLGWPGISFFLIVFGPCFSNYSVVPDLPSNIIRNIKFVIIFQSPQQKKIAETISEEIVMCLLEQQF